MKLDSFLLCEAANALDGKLYIHGGGIQRLTIPRVPWSQPSLAVLVRFLIEEDDIGREHMATFRMSAPSEEIFGPQDVPVVVPSPPQAMEGGNAEELTTNVILTLGSMPLNEAGIYTLRVDMDGQTVREFRFPVTVWEDPEILILPHQD